MCSMLEMQAQFNTHWWSGDDVAGSIMLSLLQPNGKPTNWAAYKIALVPEQVQTHTVGTKRGSVMMMGEGRQNSCMGLGSSGQYLNADTVPGTSLETSLQMLSRLAQVHGIRSWTKMVLATWQSHTDQSLLVSCNYWAYCGKRP